MERTRKRFVRCRGRIGQGVTTATVSFKVLSIHPPSQTRADCNVKFFPVLTRLKKEDEITYGEPRDW